MNENILHLAAEIPVMLLGAPGIGKTALVTQFAETLGADLVDVRLSAETPGSFEGKDYIDPKSGCLRKARAWWLQRIDRNRAGDRPTVLFFDEYTNAPDALQQLAYAPFNERRLHGESFDYRLSGGQGGLHVFGAGNRPEDETGAREMVYASKTRVFTVELEPSARDWLVWAAEHGIDSRITAFLTANPDALIEKPSTGTACPREWSNLSQALKLGIPYREAAHGTVRGCHEAEFCAFCRDSALCPTIADIVNGTARKPAAVHLAAYTAVLAFALREDDRAAEHFPAVYRWIAGQSPECEMAFTRYAVQVLPPELLLREPCRSVLAGAAKKAGVTR